MHWTYRGKAIGMTFMALFGVLWLAVAVNYHPVLSGSVVLLAACAIVLAVGCLHVFRMAGMVPAPSEKEMAVYRPYRRKIGKMFGLVFGAEFTIIDVLSNILPSMGLANIVVPAIAFTVGIHFLPLARLFKAPVYYATGLVSVAISVFALLTKTQLARQNFTCFGMCAVLWMTSVYISFGARREVKRAGLSAVKTDGN